ncbi:hypothetical protein [Chitinophaga cymbidii]|uniref:Uncharacterized protein n=1 Tax=Chitinophaga cymbidii TaxID=1096750 RepID=A0A512RPQ7_9BACT|nr:hypothetical protein [Chitinophaga cymbidii]GEP97671.1 hypothetical protein CCY01nite_39310 [Chitinophaga cymbidii]
MPTFKLHSAEYIVSHMRGFSLSEAMRFWKAKFESINHFKRDVTHHPALKDLEAFVEEHWETIQPITVQEALQETNMEKRRVMFDCIGVSRLFQSLDPTLLDKQVISKVRNRWDKKNKPYEHTFDDTYELYRLDGNKLFKSEQSDPNPVFAVRCWCTTTEREYWIYIPEEAALGNSISSSRNPDAIRAIAWTIRIDISHPKRIFRQGDIIVAEQSPQSTDTAPYHLSKEQYLSLMYSET